MAELVAPLFRSFLRALMVYYGVCSLLGLLGWQCGRESEDCRSEWGMALEGHPSLEGGTLLGKLMLDKSWNGQS